MAQLTPTGGAPPSGTSPAARPVPGTRLAPDVASTSDAPPARDTRPAGGTSWTLAEIATITRDMARLEHQLFVTLGEAARSADPPLSPDVLATWCHRHAWHAERWTHRAPVVAGWFGSDPPATWAGSAPVDDAVAALAADGFTAVATAVAALDDALALIAARTDSVTDPATARVLALVQRDVDEQRDALHS